MEQIFVMLGAATVFLVAVAYLWATRGFKKPIEQEAEVEQAPDSETGTRE